MGKQNEKILYHMVQDLLLLFAFQFQKSGMTEGSPV